MKEINKVVLGVFIGGLGMFLGMLLVFGIISLLNTPINIKSSDKDAVLLNRNGNAKESCYSESSNGMRQCAQNCDKYFNTLNANGDYDLVKTQVDRHNSCVDDCKRIENNWISVCDSM